MSIPDAPPPPPSEEGIPTTAARFSDDTEAPETEFPLISFRRYNERECEVDQGQMKPYAWNALKIVKGMGRHSSFAPNSKHVLNIGEYEDIYGGLADMPDVNIQELPLEGTIQRRDQRKTERVNEGRLFFFRTDNTVSIVAIRANHYETDKSRS